MEDVHYLETTGTGKRALEGHCGECGESMFTIGAVENETPQDLMGAKG